MRRSQLHTGAEFILISYGSGLAYSLQRYGEDIGSGKALEVFFQGDDADTFREQWEAWAAWEANRPDLSTERVMGLLWGDYAGVAELIEEDR